MHKTRIFLLTALLLGATLCPAANAAERGVVNVRTVLNVRTAPTTDAAVTTRLQNGHTVTLHTQSGDWWYAEYAAGAFGYVHASYIRKQIPDAISLALPVYRQTDRAYAGLRLPGSRERISTHGCAVTSLAMVESYRTGKSVTPKTVLAEQRFTNTGAIYWPSGYTRGEPTLADILAQLRRGVPVIVHAKKANGSSHFAVVSGFTGGALTAENFILLDPGSSARTRLSQLYAAYPYAVKTLYYEP